MGIINIKVYDNTLLAVATKEVMYYGRIGEWLLDNYGKYKPTKYTLNIYKENISEENDITENLDELCSLSEATYHVVHTSGAPIVLPVWAIWAMVAVAAVSLVATVYMMSNLPEIPSIQTSKGNNQPSGNNNLSNRSNKLRLGSRVEDAYGENIMIPSLLMPTYNIWSADKEKIECGYYCLGEGYYDIDPSDIKDGDTPINSITSAKVIVSKPFNIPTRMSNPQITIGGTNIEQVDVVKRSGVVDGIKLEAPDATSFSNTGNKSYLFGIDGSGYLVIQKDILEGGGFNTLLTIGEQVHVEVDAQITEPEPINSWTLFLNGNYKVKGMDDKFFTITNIDGSLISAFTPIPPTTLPHPVNLSRALAKVYKVSEPNPSNWTPMKRVRCPFFTKTVFINVGSSQGLGFINKNGTSEIRIGFSVEVYKEVGGVNTLIATNGANVRGSAQGTPVGRTLYLDVNVPEGTILNVRVKRTENFLVLADGTTLQNITWDDLYIKSNMMADFPKYLDTYNYTTIYTETTVNASATSVRDRELNVKARRKLPSYNVNSNTFSTTLQQNGMCNSENLLTATPDVPAILGYMAKTASIGKWYGVSNTVQGVVDVAQIHASVEAIRAYTQQIQSSVVAKNMTSFNYTFDDNNTTFEETIAVVANAIDCSAYRQGGKIRFFPNIPQQYNTIMFNHRNKISDKSDRLTRSFKNGGEYDGVEFVYHDIDTGKSESILLPLNVSAIKRKKVEIAGIRQYSQAWIRANREWNKVKYRRIQIKSEVTNEARALIVGQRVGIMDNTLFKADCGEVVAYYKDMGTFQTFLTLSDAIKTPNITNCSVYLKRRNGTAQKIGIRNQIDDYTIELALNVDEPTVTEYSNDGMRTAYTIVDNSKEISSSWVVADVEINENSSTITAYNYTDKYWETDSQPIPNKLDII